MKSTKKMIMVPEMEYSTLLNMLKNKDELGYEKSKIDNKIARTLADPKLTQLVKGKKYDWLIKQQQQMKRDISAEAMKPQNVMLDKEQLKTILSDISKYLGVEPTKIGQSEGKEDEILQTPRLTKSQRKKQKERAKKNTPTKPQDRLNQSYDDLNISGTSIPKTPAKSPQKQITPKLNYIIHPNQYNDFLKILKQNDLKLKINKRTKEILNEKDQPIEGSNYNDILDYLTGKTETKPPGTEELVTRMQGEKYYTQARDWAEQYRQSGQGKKLQLYKTTKGLIRRKQIKNQTFKPLMWAKL
jgi:hypothetical protein